MSSDEMTQAVSARPTTVIDVEHGRYPPSLEMAFRIAHVSGVALDDVFPYPDRHGASS